MQVEIEVLDDHLERIGTAPPNIWITGWIADYVGPNDFLGVLLESDSSNNNGRWTSTAFDQAVADALSTRDAGGCPGGLRARARRDPGARCRSCRSTYSTDWALSRDGLLGAGDNGLGILRMAGHGVGAVSARGPPGVAAARRSRVALASRPRGLATVDGRSPPTRRSRRRRRPQTFGDVDHSRAAGHAPGRGPPHRGLRPRRRRTRDVPRRYRQPRRRRPHAQVRHTRRHRAASCRTRLVELGFRITLEDGPSSTARPRRVRYEDDRFTWQTLEGDVVRVHWYEGTTAFGRRALDIGEQGSRGRRGAPGRRRDRFRSTSTSTPTATRSTTSSGRRSRRTSAASRSPRSGRCSRTSRHPTLATPGSRSSCPHELTHVVFDTATRNAYHEPPHWLNEGLADYLAIGYAAERGATSSARSATAT